MTEFSDMCLLFSPIRDLFQGTRSHEIPYPANVEDHQVHPERYAADPDLTEQYEEKYSDWCRKIRPEDQH